MIDLLSTVDVAIAIDSYPQPAGGARLLETDAKLRAMSLLNGRGAKEEDNVNPT